MFSCAAGFVPAVFIFVMMSRFHSYINTAEKLIHIYKGDKPFAIFLKLFFSANKKYGSKDRRQISALCYHYFRLGFAAAEMLPSQKMIMATFLCEAEPSELMENLQPEWNKKISRPLKEKLSAVSDQLSLLDIFPFYPELSDTIQAKEFCKSFLVQPDLFIRIRPQTRISVLKKLEKSKLSWQLIGEDCVKLANAENLEELFILNKEIVVQDYNSQKVLDFLKDDTLLQDLFKGKPLLQVWDCCAASGGKSILLYDKISRKINLTVSDIRASIILLLHGRFKKAGIKEYKYFIEDVTNEDFAPGKLSFDMIICDVPCTGSGTWSRTPEHLCFFKQHSIKDYSTLQRKIVSSAMPRLHTGGLFIYITCSVFKNENEVIASFISERFNCELLLLQVLKGYDKKADSMFVAVFRKS